MQRRHGVDVVGGVVFQGHVRACSQRSLDVLHAYRAVELDVDALAVAAQDGHAHAGRSDLDAVVLKDLLGFDNHLPLFFGIALGHVIEVVPLNKDVDVRDAVEGDLVCKGLGLKRLAGKQLSGLGLQLLHALGTCARRGLVAAHDDAVDVAKFAQRLECDDHLDGRAVGVCDDAVVLGDGVGVDLGHDQRNIGLNAERRGVVDHYGASIVNGLAELLGDGRSGREERDIDAIKGLVGHLLDGKLACGNLAAACKGELLAGRACGGQDADLAGRKIKLLKALEHLAANGAGGTGDSYDGVGGHRFGPSHDRFLP